MTRSERRDWWLFVANVFAVGLNTWSLTIDMAWYIFKGDAPSVLWATMNLFTAAICVRSGLLSLKSMPIARALDIAERLQKDLLADNPPKRDKVEAYVKQMEEVNKLVEKRFPEWNKKR